jgi:hypothetical protein
MFENFDVDNLIIRNNYLPCRLWYRHLITVLDLEITCLAIVSKNRDIVGDITFFAKAVFLFLDHIY